MATLVLRDRSRPSEDSGDDGMGSRDQAVVRGDLAAEPIVAALAGLALAPAVAVSSLVPSGSTSPKTRASRRRRSVSDSPTSADGSCGSGRSLTAATRSAQRLEPARVELRVLRGPAGRGGEVLRAHPQRPGSGSRRTPPTRRRNGPMKSMLSRPAKAEKPATISNRRTGSAPTL